MSERDAETRLGTPWFLFVLFAAVVVLDLILPTLMPIRQVGQPTHAEPFYFGFLIAQVGVFASLVVLVQSWPWVRVLSVPLAAALLVWYLRPFPRSSNELGLSAASLFIAQWFLVAAAMTAMSSAGWRLQRFTPSQLETTKQQRRQFTLLSLVALVTAACVVAGLAIRLQWSELLIVLVLGGTFAVPTISLVLVVLVPRGWLLPTCLTLLVGCLAIARFAAPPPLEVWIPQAIPIFFQLPVFLLMRLMGYRVWRVGPNARELQMRRDAEAARVAPAIAPSPFVESAEAQKSGSIADPNG